MNPRQRHCLLCQVLSRGEDTPFRQLMDEAGPASEVIQEKDDWTAVLDVAPIVEGWCLIVYGQHVGALREADPSGFDALIELKNRLSNAIKDAYGVRPFFFEHGGVGEHRGGACIDHAHLHVVPLADSIEGELRKECDMTPVAGIWELPRRAEGAGYVYFERPNGEALLASNADVRHQLVRRLVAQAVPGSPPWEWRQYVHQADALGTRATLLSGHARLVSNVSLPGRLAGQWKLVRDRIPALAGPEALERFGLLEDRAAVHSFLTAKLVEEATEYSASRQVEELADIVEVVLSIARCHGVDWNRLAEIAEDKRATRGGFRAGWILRLEELAGDR